MYAFKKGHVLERVVLKLFAEAGWTPCELPISNDELMAIVSKTRIAKKSMEFVGKSQKSILDHILKIDLVVEIGNGQFLGVQITTNKLKTRGKAEEANHLSPIYKKVGISMWAVLFVEDGPLTKEGLGLLSRSQKMEVLYQIDELVNTIIDSGGGGVFTLQLP